MENALNGASMAQVHDLRQQALKLLSAAGLLDQLKPFSVTHVHQRGESHYTVWADKLPSEAAVALLIPSFEPDREEYLSVSPVAPLDELVGLSLVVARDAGDSPQRRDVQSSEEAGQYAAYLKSGGCCCPFCGSDDVVGEGVEIGEGSAVQEVSCSVCDRVWYADYTLTGFREIT